MLRFLLTPRWIGLLVVVVLLGFACVKLSEWQFHRYQERKDSNALVRTNLQAEPAPVASILSTTLEPPSDADWRAVTARGHYDGGRQLAVLYRTRDGAPGVDVVTPFVTDSGAAVLVDRGWMPSQANGNQTQRLPAPASGRLTITGWIRSDSDGSSNQVTPSESSVRAISADAIRPTLPYPVYDGFLDLGEESRPSPHAPTRNGTPSLGGGPSFFYGWQWLFFAVLFFGFYGYFAWAEYQDKVKGRPRGRRPAPRASEPPSQDEGAERTPTESSTSSG